MVAGWQLFRDFRDTEEQANKIGLKFAPSKYSGMEWDTIALIPLNEDLPVYNREAEVFIGSLQDIKNWLRGVDWARNYDDIMKVSNNEKRQTAERKYHQRELVKTIRDGEKSKGIDKITG